MRRYPAFLDLSGKRCLVLGAGGVGLRKISGLLEAGAAEVFVLEAAEPSQALLALARDKRVHIARRPFAQADLDGVFLAVAATSSPEANLDLAEACAARGVLCNVADQPERSSFIVPSVIRRGELTLAISTQGGSPAVSKVLRKRLEEAVGEEYGLLLALLAALRPRLLALGMPSEHNGETLRALASSAPLLAALGGRDLDTAASVLRDTLPEDLHPIIGDLLDAVT